MIYQQYATLARLKQHRNIQSSGDDDFLMWLLRSASAMIQNYTCRSFIPYYAEKRATMHNTYDHSRLIAPDDVLALTAITDGGGRLCQRGRLLMGCGWIIRAGGTSRMCIARRN